jgi:uncharacterized Zn-finger protein
VRVRNVDPHCVLIRTVKLEAVGAYPRRGAAGPCRPRQQWGRSRTSARCGDLPSLALRCSPSIKDGLSPPPCPPPSPSVHEWDTPETVQECGYATNRSYNLKVHMASHSNKRQHRCLHCDASFTTTSNLYRHELNQHKDLAPAAAVGATAVVEELPPPSTSASTAPPPPPPGSPPAYASSEAAGSLPSSPTAVARAASAPVTKRRKTTPTCTDFVCTQAPCNNKPFSNKANLQRHIENVHESLRRYPCPFTECSKAFKQRAHLQEHLGTHAPVRVPLPSPCHSLVRCDT